jgi:hypothetical protein
MSAFIDGFALGMATKVQYAPNPNSAMITGFFGINGVMYMKGGARGRTLTVQSVWIDVTPFAIVNDELLLQNFDDGAVHYFTDTTGYTWQNVVFRSEYQRTSDRFLGTELPDGTLGWAMPYRAVFHVLI